MTELRQRVLLVEDEALVAMLLEDMLDELGLSVVAVAADLQSGLLAATADGIDLAVLDINLGGNSQSFPIADRLKQREVPVLFVTGHDRSVLTEIHRDAAVLQKPFRPEDLRIAIAKAISMGARRPD